MQYIHEGPCIKYSPIKEFTVELEAKDELIPTNELGGYFTILLDGNKKYWRFRLTNTASETVCGVLEHRFLLQLVANYLRDLDFTVVACRISKGSLPLHRNIGRQRHELIPLF